jgi:hypothetical protein
MACLTLGARGGALIGFGVPWDGLDSFAPVATAVLAHLWAFGVAVLLPGPLTGVMRRQRILSTAARLLPPMR